VGGRVGSSSPCTASRVRVPGRVVGAAPWRWWYGVLRLPETLSQLHAQGLATGPGVLAVRASSVATENAAIITFAVLAIAFVTLTSPVSGHTIPRSARHRDHRRQVG
jgi:monovalent cation/proton antiporter MnhG/PhaG subunit